MPYPILTSSKARLVSEVLEAARESNTRGYLDPDFDELEKHVVTRKGADLDPNIVRKCADRIMEINREDKRNAKAGKTDFELTFAMLFLELCDQLPTACLQDPDFWRWMSAFPFRSYIHLVEGDFKPTRLGGAGNTQLDRWPLVRGYLWGKKLRIENDSFVDLSLIHDYITQAKKVAGENASIRDFFISQVVRRKWGNIGDGFPKFVELATLAPTLVDRGKEIRPSQDFGSRAARVSANVFLPALGEDDIYGLLGPIHRSVQERYVNQLQDKANLD